MVEPSPAGLTSLTCCCNLQKCFAATCRDALLVDLPDDTYVQVNTTFGPVRSAGICCSAYTTVDCDCAGYNGQGAFFFIPASDECRLLTYSDCPGTNTDPDTIIVAFEGEWFVLG